MMFHYTWNLLRNPPEFCDTVLMRIAARGRVVDHANRVTGKAFFIGDVGGEMCTAQVTDGVIKV